MITRVYRFVGITEGALQRFAAAAVTIVTSTSTVTVELEFDAADSDVVDEYMEMRGWVPE